jgi:hypothetical protein
MTSPGSRESQDLLRAFPVGWIMPFALPTLGALIWINASVEGKAFLARRSTRPFAMNI